MIRDVIVHLRNEQPLLADLLEAPTPGDSSVICTNLRTLNGKAPVFVDRGDSTFVFPMAHIRFVEIHPASIEAATVEQEAKDEAAAADGEGAYPDPPLDRLAWLGNGGEPEGAEVGPEARDGTESHAPADAPAPEIGADELVRRVREA